MKHGVYLMRNDFHKEGIYKIGKTIHTGEHRAKRIQGGETGTPGTLRVIAFYPCSDPRRLERMLHRHFHKQRCDKRREFFEVSPETVAEAVQELMEVRYSFPGEEHPAKARVDSLAKQVRKYMDLVVKLKVDLELERGWHQELADEYVELEEELRQERFESGFYNEKNTED